MSHFSAMGVPGADREQFAAAVDRIATAIGPWTEIGDGTRAASWRDPAGTGADVLVSADDELVCLTPQFIGRSAQTVVPGRIAADPECRGCDLVQVEVQENGETAYPLVVAADRVLADRHRLQGLAGAPTTARITLVAESVEVFHDAEAYYASQDGDGPRFADRSLFPVGLFGEEPAATALATGYVIEAEVLRTELFGMPFHRIVLDTLGGRYDVVAAYDALPDGATAGQVVQVEAWVCGRIGD